ncbi:TRAP transporter small permease subunit [Halomonas sp. MCCC 1A17488]|uniref:TRAP transporter small permease protein n=1 Tax=Billgrantia sulfidoxydans TaxID=2733484 RepID=A0ABX7W6Q9_9GAMM|nr:MULTISPECIES: TRAP transporter small permease subunit [Halomonas]MCE8018011.1 TRAP transporter small permease subunit [Halomonas sp. MCCC 1A17488]MCG3241344.1 TRAP transporter small permease subunit [Halomonas sp. MCCC 1A17488]QTP56031.1 TRAP transporter small permease subunit [Halomonas sulfidoxydans]
MRFIFFIDHLSTWVGKTFAWAILLLTFVVSYEVFMRYALGAPTAWAYDTSYMLYGTLFMMSGAYALAHNAHVRADVVSRYFSPRWQAGVELALYLLFFYPGILALVWSGWDFFHASFRQNEHSSFTPGGPPIWPYKFVIPACATFLAIQGMAEVTRCFLCLRHGKWPRRLEDVEEIEIPLNKEAEIKAAQHESGDKQP